MGERGPKERKKEIKRREREREEIFVLGDV